MSGGRSNFHSQSRRSKLHVRGHSSDSLVSSLGTRIHRRSPLHSCRCSTGRCHGRTSWTSPRHGTQIRILLHYLHYPSTQIPASCSWMPRCWQRTNCTRRSTSCHCVPAGQTWACSGRSLSADEAGRCQARSCLSCRWIRLYTPPTNGWRRWIRWCFAGPATEYSWPLQKRTIQANRVRKSTAIIKPQSASNKMRFIIFIFICPYFECGRDFCGDTFRVPTEARFMLWNILFSSESRAFVIRLQNVDRTSKFFHWHVATIIVLSSDRSYSASYCENQIKRNTRGWGKITGSGSP